ncbi:MAG: hypothetical protein C4294_15870, partial [Nitrospiraceae bacterium]
MPAIEYPKRLRTRDATLERLIARIDRRLERARELSSRFTYWRLGIFVLGAAVSVAFFHQEAYHLGNIALALFLLIFLIVARYHSRLERRMHRLRLWRRMKQGHLARLRLDWTRIPQRNTPNPEAHSYAADLDLVGPHSLLQLIDTSLSSNGRERLAAWLLDQPSDPDEWLRRQSLTKELSRLSLFRDRLALEASLVDKTELNGTRIHSSLLPPIGFAGLVPLLITQALLAATTLTL